MRSCRALREQNTGEKISLRSYAGQRAVWHQADERGFFPHLRIGDSNQVWHAPPGTICRDFRRRVHVPWEERKAPLARCCGLHLRCWLAQPGDGVLGFLAASRKSAMLLRSGRPVALRYRSGWRMLMNCTEIGVEQA